MSTKQTATKTAPKAQEKAPAPAPVAAVAETPASVPAVAAPVTGAKSFQLGSGLTIKKKASVTRPVLRQIPGEPIFVTITSQMRQGQAIEGTTKQGEPKMAPAMIADINDLSVPATAWEKVIICNKVLESELTRAYPNHGYVGKSFAIVSEKPDAARGKRYRNYSITEIEFEATPNVDLSTGEVSKAAE